jgi:hypothetical protein
MMEIINIVIMEIINLTVVLKDLYNNHHSNNQHKILIIIILNIVQNQYIILIEF